MLDASGLCVGIYTLGKCPLFSFACLRTQCTVTKKEEEWPLQWAGSCCCHRLDMDGQLEAKT